jgi:hypothetical protein
VRYTPHLLPNTAYISPSYISELCVLFNPAYLQLCRLSLKYSIERIRVSITHIWTIRCASCSTFAAKWSAHQFVYPKSTLCPVKPGYLPYWRFRLKYSVARISIPIGDMSKIRCPLYSTFPAKYNAHQPVCAMPTQCPAISSVIVILQILP